MEFEISIPPSGDSGIRMTIAVEAADWTEAIQQGLWELGLDSDAMQRASFEIRDDGSMQVLNALSGRTFVIKQLGQPEGEATKSAADASKRMSREQIKEQLREKGRQRKREREALMRAHAKASRSSTPAPSQDPEPSDLPGSAATARTTHMVAVGSAGTETEERTTRASSTITERSPHDAPSSGEDSPRIPASVAPGETTTESPHIQIVYPAGEYELEEALLARHFSGVDDTPSSAAGQSATSTTSKPVTTPPAAFRVPRGGTNPFFRRVDPEEHDQAIDAPASSDEGSPADDVPTRPRASAEPTTPVAPESPPPAAAPASEASPPSSPKASSPVEVGHLTLAHDVPEHDTELQTRGDMGSEEQPALDIPEELTQALDQRLSPLVGSSMSIEEGVSHLLDVLMEFVPAEATWVLLADKKRTTLHFVGSRGAQADAVARYRIPFGTGIAGHAAATRAPLVLHPIERDPRLAKELSTGLGVGLRSLLATPITTDTDVLGVIQLVNPLGAQLFTGEHLALIGHAALTITPFVLEHTLSRRR